VELSDYQIEYRMVTSQGQTLWIRDMFHADFDAEHPARFRGVLLNITEGKEAEKALRTSHDELERRVQERTAELTRAVAALRESEQRYSLAVTGANDGLWDWNLKSGEIYFAPRWKSMLGFEDHEIGNKPAEWFSRVHSEDIERVKAELTAHLEGDKPQFQSECRMLHKDGSYRWMLTRGVAVRDHLGPFRLAGSQSDITERKVAEEQLLRDAFYDVLTNLPNRALFLDRLEGAAARANARARRGKLQHFAVLFMDLDRFKVINDSLGHLLGDELLIGIAQRLQSCIRPGDTIARLGGDEFTLLVEDVSDVRDAVGVAERIQVSLQQPFNLGGREIFTTASIGIAMSSDQSEGGDLLRDADTAMYWAKSKGKARYEIFDQSMHGRALALLQLETDLRRAVERKEFRIYYQPIVSLADGKVEGFEALVRWQHPERGMLLPEELIPLAEETGLIIPIGYGVLRDACRQMRIWHGHFGIDPFLSVNISAKQFAEPDLAEQLRSILEETEFSPEHLKLEITESIIMQDIEFASSLLQKLKDLHVRLLIDDFGTGYSSLSYLHQFPIHTLKIDRSFVSSGEKTDSWEIVKAIISLAKNLGMDVIAEGVETEYQRNYLLSLGCEKGQGFLFSRPIEAEAVLDLWRSRNS
jgi:diguanylate cyclase (GGDEF)-like protein/PAS domain S-box-containing protein